MNIKFKKTNIDGTALKFYFVNYLQIGKLIHTHAKNIWLGNIFKLAANNFEVLVHPFNEFILFSNGRGGGGDLADVESEFQG